MPFTDNAKNRVRNMVCPVHGIHPIVEEDWDGIKIICCCSDFHKECLKEAERGMDNLGQPS